MGTTCLGWRLRLDRYQGVGLSLMAFGLPFALFSYYIVLDVTLTALGLACLILGSVVYLLPSDPVPTRELRAMVEASALNIEALLEEYDAREGAVYLPPRDGRVACYVPLTEFRDGVLSSVMSAPVRVIVDAGGSRGLLVFPPGSEVIRMAEIGEDSGVEDALVYVLVDFLEAVRSVKSVDNGDVTVVQFTHPVVSTEMPRYVQCLGSMASSLAGCVLARVLGALVVFLGEDVSGDSFTARFRVIPFEQA